MPENKPADLFYPLRPYIGPKYWLHWMGIGLLWMLIQLPFSWHPRLGRALGYLLNKASSTRRKVVSTNLALCFPELSDSERADLSKQHYDHLGLMLLDLGVSWWSSPTRLATLTQIEGLEHIEKALEKGKGVVLLASHMTTMELGGQLLGQKLEELGHPIQVMYKASRNPLAETLIKRGRTRFTDRIFLHQDMRAMFRGLRNNLPSWYAPDQDFGPDHSVFAPFFGIPTASLTMTSRIAKTSKATVVPFAPIRSKDGKKVIIRIQPALENFPSGDHVEDAHVVNQTIESVVRDYPAQYFWLHRRFKTRPQGSPPIY